MTQAHSPLFLSTAIPYVNAAPHVGYAFELLIGDALARRERQRGRAVRFTAGTDDHGTKNARAASERGISTLELVTQNGDRFRHLQAALGVELDDYLHTSRDPRHLPAVVALWQRCAAAGDLYSKAYTGLYCAGCEAFLSPADLEQGRCPEHHQEPELVTETNWFFRLSRYQAELLALLESEQLKIEPLERKHEVLSFVRGGLTDFSVSRSRTRARDWGIGVPGDASQVIYVWFDALASYLASLGFPHETADFQRYWGSSAGLRQHLIGKGIVRFHAVYWPAILLSAGLPLPSTIRAHGYVTLEGNKIGKSRGNGVDPFALVESYGRAAVRFFCLRHLHTTKDSDFRLERLREAHDSELSGKLGNLLQRVAALAERHPQLALHPPHAAESDDDLTLKSAAERCVRELDGAFAAFALHEALACIWELVAAANRYADAQEPWALSRRARAAKTQSAAAELGAQLAHVLWQLCEALRVIAIALWPFLPDAAAEIHRRLGVAGDQVRCLELARFGAGTRFRPTSGPPLFPRIRRLE
jgi:methionyl-tRNA synthetase